MPLTDRKVMTFDVVGTLIDFETGILDYVQGKAKTAGVNLTDKAILEAAKWFYDNVEKRVRAA